MYQLIITTTRGDIIESNIRGYDKARRSFDSLSPNRDAGIYKVQLVGKTTAVNLSCSL